MPLLLKSKYEAFARARAAGLTYRAAYTRAGYTGDDHYGYKLGKRPKVDERVKELIAEARRCDGARLQSVIGKLMGLAAKAAKLGSASSLNTAKGLLVEAVKLRQQLDAQSFPTADEYDDIPESLSEEAWIKKYAAAG